MVTLAALGVVASVQPVFDAWWGGPSGMYVDRLGADRARAMNPFAALLAAGVALAFGSDAPVTPLGPWAAVRAGRRAPDGGVRCAGGGRARRAHSRRAPRGGGVVTARGPPRRPARPPPTRWLRSPVSRDLAGMIRACLRTVQDGRVCDTTPCAAADRSCGIICAVSMWCALSGVLSLLSQLTLRPVRLPRRGAHLPGTSCVLRCSRSARICAAIPSSSCTPTRTTKRSSPASRCAVSPTPGRAPCSSSRRRGSSARPGCRCGRRDRPRAPDRRAGARGGAAGGLPAGAAGLPGLRAAGLVERRALPRARRGRSAAPRRRRRARSPTTEGATTVVHDDEQGIYGHPDHRATHRIGATAAELLGASAYRMTVDREHLHVSARDRHLVHGAARAAAVPVRPDDRRDPARDRRARPPSWPPSGPRSPRTRARSRTADVPAEGFADGLRPGVVPPLGAARRARRARQRAPLGRRAGGVPS